MSIVKVERSVYSHLDGQRQRELRVESDADGYVVTLRSRQTKIKIEDPRAWSGTGAGKASSGIAKVATPMPGKVIRVLIALGDRVESGQGLVVVEAMKMQNELKSPISGTVKQVQAVEGATVNANQVLVVVESDAS